MSMSRAEKLASSIANILSNKLVDQAIHLNELTVVLESQDLLDVAKILRDHPDLAFDTLVDLCGVDYSTYTNTDFAGKARGVGGLQLFIIYYQLNITIV